MNLPEKLQPYLSGRNTVGEKGRGEGAEEDK